MGREAEQARVAAGLTRKQVGTVMKSTDRSILRLERGRVYGHPDDVPSASDYNSEGYWLPRLWLLEQAVGWPPGRASEILRQEI
ncbi:hypothetical protein GCM10009738_66710 [Kitasatospora viridis]